MRRNLAMTILILLGAGCGKSGESGDDASATQCCGKFINIRGSVTSKSLAGVTLENWILLLIERDTGTARSSILGAGGLFLFRNAKGDAAHTLALLSPEYILQSVVSFPADQPGAVHQYFKFNKLYLGNVIHDGPVLSLEHPDNIAIEQDLARDGDGDGLPDGTVQIGAETLADGDAPDFPMDLDHIDSDFDGLVNSLDHDDDNDGIFDMADADSNGDDVPDREQDSSDLHFSEGVEAIMAQYEYDPAASGSRKAYMTFTARLRDDINPFAVGLAGPARLLDGASYEGFDNTNQPIDAAWNRRLADDGNSQDELPNDRIFAKKIKLASSSLRPKSNEVFLIQLLLGSEQDPWAYSYPISFPNITTGTITAAFNETTNVVTLGGNPFGTIANYEWTVVLSNPEGAMLWSSQSVPVDTKTFTVPAPQLTSGRTYAISVTARLPDRVRASPSYVVHSPKIEVIIP